MKRALLWTGGIFLLLLLLLPSWFSVNNPLWTLATELPFGWVHFLKRNAVQLTWNWNLIAMGIVCSLILVVLGHLLFQSTAGSSTAGSRRAGCSWRRSLVFYGAIWVLFAITFGATGVFRHVRWLAAIDAPWYEEQLNYYNEVRQADGWIQQMLLENKSDLDRTCQAVAFLKQHRKGRELYCDLFNFVFYADQDGKVQAYVLIPRKADLRKRGVFFVSEPDVHEMDKPLTELPATLARLDKLYPIMHR